MDNFDPLKLAAFDPTGANECRAPRAPSGASAAALLIVGRRGLLSADTLQRMQIALGHPPILHCPRPLQALAMVHSVTACLAVVELTDGDEADPLWRLLRTPSLRMTHTIGVYRSRLPRDLPRRIVERLAAITHADRIADLLHLRDGTDAAGDTSQASACEAELDPPAQVPECLRLPALPFGKLAGHTASVPLTRRQRQVLAGIGSGWSNARIGQELSIAEQTVKVHVRHVYRRLAVDNRSEACVAAWRLGLVDNSRHGGTGAALRAS